MSSHPLISIHNLTLGFLGRDQEERPILRNVSLEINAGETMGIVGESGSGKSTVALAMMGYLKPGLQVFDGHAHFNGHDMFAISNMERTKLRGSEISLIPQNAGQSLTPTLKIGDQIEETLALHTEIPTNQRRARVIELLSRVRLPSPEDIAERYPHELSGGQQQRVAIAMALGTNAKALLLDEPTTGLDVTTQAHILEFMKSLARELKISMVFVSHDLGVIARVADRIAVMYAGELVEEGTVKGLLNAPAHPYPRALLGSIPRLGEKAIPASLAGFPPPVGENRSGCAFVARCPKAHDKCHRENPPLISVAHGYARCWIAGEDHSPLPAGTPIHSTATDQPAIDAVDLVISYHKPGLLDQLTQKPTPPDTVSGVNFSVRKGETLGLVGESGSGKSTILRAISGLKPPKDGKIMVADNAIEGSVTKRTTDQLKPLQMIFQNADSSLNPRRSIREILEAPLRLYFNLTREELDQKTAELIEAVRLPRSYLDRFPGQLSGGEKQRIGIARAFAAEPELVLCDEVTSALDVSVQAAALALLKQLQDTKKAAYIFVSHDLAVVRAISDQIAVLYQGRICEIGPTEQVFASPFHPYTEALLGAILEPDPDTAPRLIGEDVVEKAPPQMGCPFQRRCHRHMGDKCNTEFPPKRTVDQLTIYCHMNATELNAVTTAEMT